MSSSTKDLLKSNQIFDAIVVDDVYDSTPTVADLVFDQDQWTIFLDDQTEDDSTILRSVFPEYENGQESQLFQSDDSIARLWDARGLFREELIGPLFQSYIDAVEQDLRIVKVVESQLVGLDLNVQTAGRDFFDAAVSADLVVIDLFLGTLQSEFDMSFTIERLIQVVNRKLKQPPIIILMSRSGQLQDKAEVFRDEAKVFASGFRTIRKSELEKSGRLEYLVRELARNREDSLKLNTFLLGWKAGLSDAITRSEKDIRRLDLEDWAQIHDLLLSAEESSAGRYIFEILEYAFLYELESEHSILAAAACLNGLNRETYPATTIAGSKDTLGLIAKTLYEHKNCYELDDGAAAPVAFGDLIGLVPGGDFEKDPAIKGLQNAVLVAMTPGCDLQRATVQRILFMVGKTEGVDAANVRDASKGLRTPILFLEDGDRVWVDWQPKNLITLTFEEVETMLSVTKPSLIKLGRLRSANALALQQQLLSNLGRVGLVAPMPSTFPIQVSIYYPSEEGVLTSLLIDGKESIGGVCYVGRDSEQLAQAPLDSAHRFDFIDALEGTAVQQVHNRSHNKVSEVRRVEVIDLLFGMGLRFDISKTKAREWKVTLDGKEVALGYVVHRPPVSEHFTKISTIPSVGLVFEIHGLTTNPDC